MRGGGLFDVDIILRPLLHRQIAQAIEDVYGNDDQHVVTLLEHWTQAGDVSKQTHFAQLAGDQALRISAFKQALAFYKRALEYDPNRLNLLLRIGETNR